MNPGPDSEEVEIKRAYGATLNIHAAYETSAENDLKKVTSALDNRVYSFPAESVTTLVGIDTDRTSLK